MDLERPAGERAMNQSTILSSVQKQFKEQATPRALAGLAALVVILALWGLGELNASVMALRQSVDELERSKRLELSLISDQSWLNQAGDIQQRLEQTQETFWEGGTNGIIAAQLQGAVESAARNAGLSRIRVSVTGVPEPLGESASLFEVSITAWDTEGQFLAFYQELSRTENLVVVSRFSWRRSNGSLDMRILAPARLTNLETAS